MMVVVWYPGHMHKAQKQIKEVMPQVDLVIEVMDARIPFSSENPVVKALRGPRPCLKVLNKSDLADPAVTAEWLHYFSQQEGVRAIALTTTRKGESRKILGLCRDMVPLRVQRGEPVRVMIMGIPNVGKSTLINALAGRAIAKVGDEPAVTKQQQRISLGNGIVLSDTPGILWPRMEDQNSGYRLAVTGAIKNAAITFEDIAVYAGEFLLQHYPQALMARYKLNELPLGATELIEAIGRKRGCLRPGGVLDLHKASEILLKEFRSGKLGGVSLETPAIFDVLAQDSAESESALNPVD
ncbi:LSU ribosomal maturation GTPase RbgA (B. subtilis YlqF) [hydrothermal vent metagenome]|uniref:LSU ribosomal maturation GTPase RbgA (B. subtilis YlqF) n=1 Tax=hydrothermal vent metagenome TaxID=652676 RepID=A0A3B0ZY86_9ZZZZ